MNIIVKILLCAAICATVSILLLIVFNIIFKSGNKVKKKPSRKSEPEPTYDRPIKELIHREKEPTPENSYNNEGGEFIFDIPENFDTSKNEVNIEDNKKAQEQPEFDIFESEYVENIHGKQDVEIVEEKEIPENVDFHMEEISQKAEQPEQIMNDENIQKNEIQEVPEIPNIEEIKLESEQIIQSNENLDNNFVQPVMSHNNWLDDEDDDEDDVRPDRSSQELERIRSTVLVNQDNISQNNDVKSKIDVSHKNEEIALATIEENSNISVLIADDAKFMRNIMKNIVQEAGYEVIGEVENGRDVVKVAAKLNPTIILMDILMPDKDGISATKEILQIHPDTKIIMCTAVNDPIRLEDAVQVGAKGVISKPFNKESAIKIIAEALTK